MSERHQPERSVEEEFRHTLRRQTFLNTLLTALSRSPDVRGVVDGLEEMLRNDRGLKEGCILLYDEDADVLRPASAWGGMEAIFPADRPVPVAGGPLERAVRSGRAGPPGLPGQACPEALSHSLLVPLVSSRVQGVACLSQGDDDASPVSDGAFYEALGREIGIVLENARQLDRVRREGERLRLLCRRLMSAQEDERRHVVRELHDHIGQLLTGLELRLATYGRGLEDGAREAIQECRALVGEAHQRMRPLALGLGAPALDQMGLRAALTSLFERFGPETGIGVVFEQAGIDGRFPMEHETTAYRIVQAALAIVAGHAGVERVIVRAWVTSSLLVQVEGTGSGVDALASLQDPDRPEFVEMLERVSLLGGSLDVETVPGSATRLTATLPLSANERAESDG